MVKKDKQWYQIHKKQHIKSNQRWMNKNKRNHDKARLYRKRSYTKNFIIKASKPEALPEVRDWLLTRRSQLEKQNLLKKGDKRCEVKQVTNE